MHVISQFSTHFWPHWKRVHSNLIVLWCATCTKEGAWVLHTPPSPPPPPPQHTHTHRKLHTPPLFSSSPATCTFHLPTLYGKCYITKLADFVSKTRYGLHRIRTHLLTLWHSSMTVTVVLTSTATSHAVNERAWVLYMQGGDLDANANTPHPIPCPMAHGLMATSFPDRFKLIPRRGHAAYRMYLVSLVPRLVASSSGFPDQISWIIISWPSRPCCY